MKPPTVKVFHINRRLVKILLAKKEWDQSDLCAELGLTDSTLSMVLRGRRPCSPLLAERIAEALGVSLRAILGKPPETTQAA